MEAGDIQIPETLHGAIQYFSNADTALRIMVTRRWPDGVKCPYCATKEVSFMAARSKWQCRLCRKQFSVKVGTIFEDSPIGLDKWLSAMWLITNAKNGISSCELHRALGVTQKTAWFMLHRIRLALQNGTIEKMKGTVEADETFIGGLAKNMHWDKRQEKIKGRGPTGKDIVMGLLERGEKGKSKVHAKVVKSTDKKTLHGQIKANVESGAKLYTDTHTGYNGLHAEYVHEAVNHAIEYVRENVHVNGLENFWCLLKRTLKGTYVSVNAEHLFRYLDEQSFRFNERKDNDQGRFWKALASVIGKRLLYAKLIGKEGGDCLPGTAWQTA